MVAARRTAALRDVAAAATDVSSVGEACVRALEAVSRHTAEIPFALLYVVHAGDKTWIKAWLLRLEGCAVEEKVGAFRMSEGTVVDPEDAAAAV